MGLPIQVTIADQRGLDLKSLFYALYLHYRTPAGSPVMPRFGQGVNVDGVPNDTIRLVDRGET